MASVRVEMFLIAISVLSWAAESLSADPVVPSDGMVIIEDTVLEPGTYDLPNGINIGASGITLDMNGATLLGTAYENYGVTCIGFDDVTITGGSAHNYYYGVRAENGSGIEISQCDLSANWVDPRSLGNSAPFLNINVGPNLGDRTNLGGGLFLRDLSGATIDANVLKDQENGMDLYEVTGSLISGNDASNNTGWGIHLHLSSDNTIDDNVMDHCIRTPLGDSAGMLLVMGSNGNTITNNSFREGGDGFFIGNEGGCPSNDNLVQGNDGSAAGANAFEATFSSGNQFIDNVADGSNYGFWLGYSHTGNVIRGNSIRANNVNGIEIEHGQGNIIEANEIIGNGGRAIVLRTDGLVHFPPAQYPCLDLPDQASSSDYQIRDNIIKSNFSAGMELVNTTDSIIVNNVFAGNAGGTVIASGANNTWSVDPIPGENIVGGSTLGGNYWDNYDGEDLDGDDLGDTNLPYANGGQIDAPGDPHPLVGDVDVGGFDNPLGLCYGVWIDVDRNTHGDGSHFDTSNGAHFATNGVDLFLLEGRNGGDFSRYDPQSNRYERRAALPEGVWDGGDLQFASDFYFATVAVAFNPVDGTGKGPRLYRYHASSNSWSPAAGTQIAGQPASNEALAYDPIQQRLYVTIVATMNGADPSLRERLAVYDVLSDIWLGVTSPSGTDAVAGSEAEYLDGKIYIWPGGSRGGNVSGSDSLLQVYDIDTDTWSKTPSLAESDIIPGFRSGAFDIWGVTLTADTLRGNILVQGGESNRQIYVFNVAQQRWYVTRLAAYDGGWGDGLEYTAADDRVYQIDGRNSLGQPQGSAMLVQTAGDLNGDGCVNQQDLGILLASYEFDAGGDLDCDGDTDQSDLGILLANYDNCP